MYIDILKLIDNSIKGNIKKQTPKIKVTRSGSVNYLRSFHSHGCTPFHAYHHNYYGIRS